MDLINLNNKVFSGCGYIWKIGKINLKSITLYKLKVDKYLRINETDAYLHLSNEINKEKQTKNIKTEKFKNEWLPYGYDYDINKYYKKSNDNLTIFDGFINSKFRTNTEQFKIVLSSAKSIIGFMIKLRPNDMMHKRAFKLFFEAQTVDEEMTEDIKREIEKTTYKDLFLQFITFQQYEELDETCCICLEEDQKVYKGHFICCHGICNECYEGLHRKVCPLCRSN